MDHSVLLVKNNWLFSFDSKRILIKHRNVLIASNNDDFYDLIKQATFYRGKMKNDVKSSCLVKIYNTTTNTVLIVKKHELLELHIFLNSIKRHVLLINKHTHSSCNSYKAINSN